MSAQQYYQGNDEPAAVGGTDRGYGGPQGGYNNYAPPQGQPGGYQAYPPPNNGQQWQAPQQPPQAYNGNQNYPQQQQPPPPQGQPNYGMKPTQPYAYAQGANQAEHQPQNYHQQDTAPFSQADEKTGERMNPKPRFNDIIPLVLFIAAFAGFVVISVLALKDFASLDGLGGGFGRGSGGSSVTLNFHTVYLLLIVCAIGLVIASLWLALVRAFTKVIIEITLALTVLLNVALCIYYYIIKLWSAAIIFTVIAVLSVLFYWSMRKRIPLAKLLIQTTVDISKHHISVYVVVIIGLIVQAAWSVYYALTVVGIYVKWTPDSQSCTTTSCSSAKVAGLIFYATFAYYWVSQVIANVTLTTLSGGVFGGWYYFGPRSAGGGVPKGATVKALARSLTYNLGSIAFGSLIVTILELIRLLLNAASQYARSEGSTVGAILACCAACCISCIQGLVEFFNKYAYIEISLYGKAYIPAAKDTWRLMKDRGIDALINDSLVGTVIMWGAYVNGFLCALFGYLYLRFTDPAYNSDGQYTPYVPFLTSREDKLTSRVIILFSFLIGINEGLCLGSVMDAGASTIFVGMAEDPMVLADRSPALFQMIQQAYPKVVQGVPHRN